MARMDKFVCTYRTLSLLLLNVLVVFTILNVILYLVLLVLGDPRKTNPVAAKYGMDALLKVYPDKTPDQVDQLMIETWTRTYVYEPFTGFRERPCRGTYVNVAREGFRVSANQAPWPPDPNSMTIFVFGGSTAFGYGVADFETVASCLQQSAQSRLQRRVSVYNFGRGHYYSTQERILFEQLCTAGYVPDLAVFIDGLNEFYYDSDEPKYTERFREFMEGRRAGRPGLLSKLPFSQAVERLTNAVKRGARKYQDEDPADTTEYDDPAVLKRVLNRYLANKRIMEAVAESFGVTPVFVWQPAPTYHHDDSQHPLKINGYGRHTYSRYGYRDMAQLADKMQLGPRFLWCADIHSRGTGILYSDRIHYSAPFSKVFAEYIVTQMIERGILK